MKCLLAILLLGIATQWSWGGEIFPAHSIALLSSAVAGGDTILLSDLLPASAPTEIRAAASKIELGRAPRPGGLRVFKDTQITPLLAGHSELLDQLSLPKRVRVRRMGWPIGQMMIEKAISLFSRGQASPKALPLGTPLQWPKEFQTAEPDPPLETVRMDWDREHSNLQFQMRCADRAMCGSFLVFAALPQPLPEEWRRALIGKTNFDAVPQRSAKLQTKPTSRKSFSGPVLAEAGKPAMLLLEGQGVRISLPVICLERGRLAQAIRVREVKGRRVFYGEVVSAGVLRGEL